MASLVPLVLIVLGFWAGAVPFGVLLARRRGVRIQDHGSGNIGATNVARVLGTKLGFLVLLLDASKGAVPVLAAIELCGDPRIIALTGFAAILGHCFSPFLHGKGGKGVATAFGVFLVLDPVLAAVAVGVFAIVLARTRVPALGSLAGIAAISIGFVIRGDRPYIALACLTLALLIHTHRSNLAKLKR